jgi:ABC-type multidrug transport system ATPase subunit
MEMAGIYELADRRCGTLSGWEIQRLGLAQAWLSRPDLLILDEPAASLDPAGRYAVLSMMRELQKESTIFFSTHILEDVERVSDHLIILNRGEVIMNGSSEELRNSEEEVNLELEFSGGNPEALKARLLGKPWIRSIAVQEGLAPVSRDKGERACWLITVDGSGEATGGEAADNPGVRKNESSGPEDASSSGDASRLESASRALPASQPGENLLLKTLLEEPGIRIHRFGEKQKRLEEVFLGMTRGAQEEQKEKGEAKNGSK